MTVKLDARLAAIFSVTLITVLGTSSIAPALPRIAEKLALTPKEVVLLITIFTLPGVLFMPILGFLGDRLGRKKILVPSLFLFAITGTICGWVQDFGWLLTLRFLQGLSAASLGTLNVTLIGDQYTGEARIDAMGKNASVLSLGTAFYPVIGGMLAALSWSYPFFLSFLAFPIGFFVMKYLPDHHEPENAKIDLYLRDLLKLVNQKRIFGLFAANTVSFIIIYGVGLTLFPFYLKQTFDMSPTAIGIFLFIMSVGTICAAWFLKPLARILKERNLILLGFAIYALGAFAVTLTSDFFWIAVIAFVLGAANGMNVPTIQGLMTEYAPSQQRAAVMALSGMFLRVGKTIGPVAAGIILETSMNLAFLSAALVALLTLALLAVLVR